MEIVAHGLWTAAAAIAVKRKTHIPLRTGWTVWWGVFPDVFAFGPRIAAGLFLWLAGAPDPHVRIGLPLYPMAHSLLVFLLVFGVVSLAARRVVWEMLGWLLHIAIDVPTHSLRYYATRFLWPVSDFRIDGIPWWTPWLWIATYVALAVVYFLMWRKGWLSRNKAHSTPAPTGATSRRA